MSQSGALGIAVIDVARGEGLGLSSFVSIGNKADLSGNDFLAYWDRDDADRRDRAVPGVVREPAASSRAWRARSRRTSRSSRSRAAARRPARGPRARTRARCSPPPTRPWTRSSRQSGVVRTDTLGELFDVAGLLAAQPPPAGSRVGIITNGGGLGILCADACQAAGLEVVPTPAGASRRRCAPTCPTARRSAIPVDLLASCDAPSSSRQAIELLAGSGAVDALDRALRAAAGHRSRRRSPRRCAPRPTRSPCPSSASSRCPSRREARRAALPSFRFPEDAARAARARRPLRRLAERARRARARPRGRRRGRGGHHRPRPARRRRVARARRRRRAARLLRHPPAAPRGSSTPPAPRRRCRARWRAPDRAEGDRRRASCTAATRAPSRWA